jgi:hypothetical protein
LKKVVVFIPCAGVSFSPIFVESYLKARMYFQTKMDGYELIEYFPKFSPNMGAMRNLCVGRVIEGFREFYPDISIWLDIDHELPYDVLVKLLEHDFPVVGGMYFFKRAPHKPVIFKKVGHDKGLKQPVYSEIEEYDQVEPFEVDNTGMGCMRIDRDVLLKLKAPYFYYRPHSSLENTDHLEFAIKYRVDNNTEDFPFFEQVKKAGYKIMIDPTIQLGHLKTQIIRQEHWLFNKVTLSNSERNILEANDFDIMDTL